MLGKYVCLLKILEDKLKIILVDNIIKMWKYIYIEIFKTYETKIIIKNFITMIR